MQRHTHSTLSTRTRIPPLPNTPTSPSPIIPRSLRIRHHLVLAHRLRAGAVLQGRALSVGTAPVEGEGEEGDDEDDDADDEANDKQLRPNRRRDNGGA